MNWVATRYQNMFGTLTVANNKLDKQLGNQLTDSLLGIAQGIGDETTSVGLQSSLAQMFYLGVQGTWDADPQKLEQIANEYMNQVIQYGVACCHHTCKNLDFNMKIIQASSLTPSQKQKFAEILAQATNTAPLYQAEEQDNPNGETSNGEKTDGDKNAHQLVNGTTVQESDMSGGQTSAGNDASTPGDAKAAAESQSSASSSQSGAGESGATAYELSQKSASKSMSSAESSMPIFVIIAIIVLIAIFLVGYVRSIIDDYDDY